MKRIFKWILEAGSRHLSGFNFPAPVRVTIRKFLPLSLAFVFFIGPEPGIAAGQLKLSLNDAIQIAVAESRNARVRIANEILNETEARLEISRAPLLPQVSALVGQNRQTRNPYALGLGSIPGFRPPKLIGPFNVFDARGEIQQKILDISSIRRYQASKAALEMVSVESERTKDEVAAETARAYLEALAARVSLETAQSSVRLAEELLSLARQQKEAGTGVRIEVTRAEVQLADRKQRMLSTESRFRQAKTSLLRVIGIDMETDLILTEKWDQTPEDLVSVGLLITEALGSRSDLKAQRKRERSAELQYAATKAERLPSLSGFANYGSSGNAINDSVPTWAIGLSLELPIYDGGAVDARRAEQNSRLSQEKIRTKDLARQVELEVRLAHENVRVAREQIPVAEKRVTLVGQELEQARRRYQAGVTTSLELTDAQTRLQQAEEIRVEAFRHYYFARIGLLNAVGILRNSRVM